MAIAWCDVRLGTVDGRKVILVTEQSRNEFEFKTEAEARCAFRKWLEKDPKQGSEQESDSGKILMGNFR